MNSTEQTTARSLPENITHMARNVECRPLFEVTNTVLELVKVHPLPSGEEEMSHVTPVRRAGTPAALLTAPLSDDGAELVTKQWGITEGVWCVVTDPGLLKNVTSPACDSRKQPRLAKSMLRKEESLI